MVKKGQPDYGNIRVFVYGTLKTKNGNNALLREAGARFLGYDYVEVPRAKFLDLGFFPGVIQPIQDGDTAIVRGEIWYGPQEILTNLDIMEGHPNFFRREKVWSKIHERRCWMYSLPERHLDESTDEVQQGLWRPSKDEERFWEKQA